MSKWYEKVGNAVGDVANWSVKAPGRLVGGVVEGVATPVFGGLSGTIYSTGQAGSTILNGAGSGLSQVGSSLTLPLIVVGGLAVVLLFSGANKSAPVVVTQPASETPKKVSTQQNQQKRKE